jgi:lipocalin
VASSQGGAVKIAKGHRYMTRSGAVVRVSYVHPFDPWRYIVCVIERRADGSECDPERPCKISLCPDGRYFPRDEDHELDLVSEVAVLGSVAA